MYHHRMFGFRQNYCRLRSADALVVLSMIVTAAESFARVHGSARDRVYDLSRLNSSQGRMATAALGCPRPVPDFRFNVSHRGDVAVFALARQRKIGTNIEALRCIDDADQTAARLVSRCESSVYPAVNTHDKPLVCLNCWARREALIKATSVGLYHPVDRYDVSLAPGESTEMLRVENEAGEDCGWAIYGLAVCHGFVGSAVVKNIHDEPFSAADPKRTARTVVPTPGLDSHA